MFSPLLVLQARAEARALLWQAGEYTSVELAIDPLWEYAYDSGMTDDIGVQAVAAIIDRAFSRVSD